MRKATAIVTYKYSSPGYKIGTLSLLTKDLHLLDMPISDSVFSSITDLTDHIVNLAKANNYKISVLSTDFNAKMYDIVYIEAYSCGFGKRFFV